MRFVIPSSKNKRYLSGTDWVITTLDCMLKATTCTGNSSQVVFVMDSQIDEDHLRQCLDRVVHELPILTGSISRDINLAPYWRIPRTIDRSIGLTVTCMEDTEAIEDVIYMLEEGVNRPFDSDSDHLCFHLIHLGNRRSILAMTFDHRLLDARGAEAFLYLLREYIAGNGRTDISDGIPLVAPAFLSNWMEKFYSGRNINRKVRALTRQVPDALPIPPGKKRKMKFKVISFGADESEKIYATAYSEAGYLMEMPFLLSAVTHAIHSLFSMRGIGEPNYLIPITVDMRTSEDIRQELFFNHVSYLFFRIRSDDMENSKKLIQSVKEQMYEQVKTGLPQDICNASHLTRIAPLSVYRAIFRLPFKGKIASFCFANLGKSLFKATDFMGANIGNCFHMPRVPVPPGLGFFFNHFHGRLNLVISHLDGLMQDSEIIKIEENIRKELGVSHPQ